MCIVNLLSPLPPSCPMQVVARPYKDEQVLRLLRELELAREGQ